MRLKKILVLFFIFSSILCGCSSKQEEITINPFENIKITQHGWNGSGYISVKKGTISYDGNDETIKKLIKSIDYKINNNSKLSNGDKVKITFSCNSDYKELSDVKFKKKSYIYTISDLQDDNRTIRNDERVVVNEDTGESKTVYTETMIVDGVEIPMDWNLSDDEIQDYVAYIKSMNSDEVTEESEVKVKQNWTKGTSKKKTYRKKSNFYFTDYNNNSSECYQAAYEYGNGSSQKYKIEPILEEEKTIGYKCIFKGEK